MNTHRLLCCRKEWPYAENVFNVRQVASIQWNLPSTNQKYFRKLNRSKYKGKYERNSEADKFRNTAKWRNKRNCIQQRDRYMCRYCFLVEKKIVTSGLSVHHIVPLAVDYSMRLDDNNLITLCRSHHELAESGIISAAQLLQLIDEPLQIPPE